MHIKYKTKITMMSFERKSSAHHHRKNKRNTRSKIATTKKRIIIIKVLKVRSVGGGMVRLSKCVLRKWVSIVKVLKICYMLCRRYVI